ncbi:CHAT domain containing protein [Flavobacterium anhuiense]|uniref:CHAT domain containing protein n=1 Tax=Flavobacterium anhuiense TaxID=459526 RepID=A0A444W367_9FLAO|nr:CHAT domain-containing tetratricopeptide repeat protein [Flavobacterium anhuiense]RYJ40088.1 CHAT domain containing protein [Flavobacterium anhuiense]
MNLHHLYGFMFLFLCLNVFGQNQEDKIYNAVDSFTANPSAEALQNLRNIESDFWKSAKTKTKDELLAIVILNCNKAYYENQFGQNLDAIKSYEKAWMIYQKNKLKNYDIIEFCLKPLGNLYTVLGDYENAENTIKQYYFIASQQKNKSQKTAAILNLSNVYQNTGNVYKAIELIEKTIQTEKLSAVEKGLLLNNLGTNYVLSSKKAEAETSFLKAVSLLKNYKTQTETLANAYRNLAQLKVDQNDFKKASEFFEKAKTEFNKNPKREPRKIGQFYYEAAFISFSEGNLIDAQQNLEIVFKTLLPNYSASKNRLPNGNSLYAETVLLDALDLQALIYLAENQPKNALKSYELSFKIEEMIQSLLVYENSKIITQVRNRNRTEKCIEIYLSLFERERKMNYIESAFLLSEHTKSVVLKRHLKNIETISREEKLILQQLQNWNTIILKEQQKLEAANISKINEAVKKQNELMLLLKTKQNKTDQKKNSELDLTKLYDKLKKDNAALVEYFFGSHCIYNFTLENKKIILHKIETFDKELLSFIGLFKDPSAIANNPKKYNLLGNKVYQKLQIPKLEKHKNLIIVPDGILSFLPFEALISEISNTSNFTKMHYLLDKFDVAYNNSAELYLNANTLSNGKNNILGLFPIFEKTNYELPFSKNELQSIKHNFDGQFFENKNADFSNFKNNAIGKSIIHLSTHASSGDLETPASIKFYDQEVLFSELYNLQFNPDLVVLSACETGIGKLYKGEGAMSVARGFQFAGAQNLLFSLWNVNDYTTSVFMDYFYKEVKHNSSFVHATSNAKREFLKDENVPNAKKSPYYWSAFVYYGTLEKPEKQTNYILYIISFLGLIGLFLGFNHYRNGKSSRNSQNREIQKNKVQNN